MHDAALGRASTQATGIGSDRYGRSRPPWTRPVQFAGAAAQVGLAAGCDGLWQQPESQTRPPAAGSLIVRNVVGRKGSGRLFVLRLGDLFVVGLGAALRALGEIDLDKANGFGFGHAVHRGDLAGHAV